MFATSAPVLSPQQLDWQFPLVQAEFFTHKLSAPANAIAQSHDWLVVAVGRTVMLHRFKQLDWSRPHREFSIGFIPQHLLLAGMDSRYIIAINTDGHYEVYDRVNLEAVQHGRFSHHRADSQYQIVSQQYLLASSDSNLYFYSTTSMAQPLMQSSMPGKICAVACHQASSTFYCVSQNDKLHITPLQLRSGIENRLPPASYPMQFVGLSCAGNHLMLQGLRADGQLRLMTYDLPDLQLVAVQEKSLAYEGLSSIHPTQPWAATDLGNGLLIWDTQRFVPIALIQFPPPLAITALSWLDSGQLLFVHGDTIELWSFRSTETPFLNAYTPQTIKALQDFQRWVTVQRSAVGISFIVGEESIGKTAIARAFSEYNFANTLHMVVPEAANAEIKAILFPHLNANHRLIFLDQAENLSLELISELQQIAQQEGISLVLITRHVPDIEAVPVYQFFPIDERVNLGDVAAYFAPEQGRHRHYIKQVKPILEASARRRTIQAAT
jgi:hypothetical protein